MRWTFGMLLLGAGIFVVSGCGKKLPLKHEAQAQQTSAAEAAPSPVEQEPTPTPIDHHAQVVVIGYHRLVDKVKADGHYLAEALCRALGGHPHVGDIRGRGLFWAVELVQDRATKAPFDPVARLHARVKRECMARGLMTYPMAGTIDGCRGDHVLIAPPFIVEDSHLELILERLHAAIDAAVASLD
jgi:acetylornithine/succinyldiaminopimelate/putrescine aminotransferase